MGILKDDLKITLEFHRLLRLSWFHDAVHHRPQLPRFLLHIQYTLGHVKWTHEARQSLSRGSPRASPAESTNNRAAAIQCSNNSSREWRSEAAVSVRSSNRAAAATAVGLVYESGHPPCNLLVCLVALRAVAFRHLKYDISVAPSVASPEGTGTANSVASGSWHKVHDRLVSVAQSVWGCRNLIDRNQKESDCGW